MRCNDAAGVKTFNTFAGGIGLSGGTAGAGFSGSTGGSKSGNTGNSGLKEDGKHLYS